MRGALAQMEGSKGRDWKLVGRLTLPPLRFRR